MKKTTFNQHGFTIIELMVVIVAVAAISVVALSNVRTIRAQNRDTTKKQDINAVFYQLESFHETNGYYPQVPTEKTLKGIDPASLVDNNTKSINQPGSAYVYTPSGCKEQKCTSYSITSTLELEVPFSKQSLIQ